MKIVYLKLKNFKRFPLRDLEVFEEDFSGNRLIGILGCNGSGKSSLIRELSPFPSSKEHFFNNGYKEIHILHKNNLYILKSIFEKESVFSFCENDIELNTSGLITIQKELIKKYFNLTEDIFDILIGNVSFCNMNNLQRKKLFNSLTNINIDSFLEIYEKFKEEEKNESNMFKIYTSNYQLEYNKLEDKSKYEAIVKRKNDLNEYLNILIELRSNIKSYLSNSKFEDSKRDYDILLDKIKYVRSKYYTLLTSFPFNNLFTLYDNYSNRKSIILSNLNLNYNKLENLNKEINRLKIIKNNDKIKLEETKIDLINKINNLTNGLVIFKRMEYNIDKVYSELLKIESSLMYILDELESNSDKRYTIDKLNSNLENKNNLLNEINKINELILIEQGRLKHLQDYHINMNIECPKCNHVFSPSLSEKLILNINEKIEKFKKDKINLEEKLKVINEYIEKANKYLLLLSNYEKIIQNTPILEELWEYIKSKNMIIDNPKSILNVLSLALQDISNIKNINEFNKNITEINNMLNILQNKTLEDFEYYENEYKEINECIYNLNEEKKNIEDILANIDLSRKVYDILFKLESSKIEKENNLKQSCLNEIYTPVIETIESEISKTKASLIELESYIKNYDNILSLLEKYKNDIEISKNKLHIINLLIKELSPKNGLIAKIISNYLNNIIKYINKIVESIMEYNVKIELLNVEENVLDYKFKFIVENKIEVNDVSKASSGMKEIIDLGFKLVFYKLLKLENYPLYLDEFGVRLDSIHKSKIHNLIFKFINDSSFSQIFLITHLDTGLLQHKDSKIITLS